MQIIAQRYKIFVEITPPIATKNAPLVVEERIIFVYRITTTK